MQKSDTRSQNYNAKFRNILTTITLLLLLIGGIVYNRDFPKEATVGTNLPKKVAVNQAITVPIFIETGGETINAAEVYLHFDPSLVRVNSVSKEGSFFQLWVLDEPKFSNEQGAISFAGGLPTPGFKGRDRVGSVSLTLLQPGPARLTFDAKTRILKNDGAGTAVPLRLEPIELRGR